MSLAQWGGMSYMLLSVLVAMIAMWRSTPRSTARAFAWWFVAVAVGNVAQLFVSRVLRQSNLWVGHAYHPVAALLLAGAGWRAFESSRMRRGAVVVGAGVAVVCVALIVSGIQSVGSPSRYGSPTFYLAATLLGVLLIVQAIGARAVSPLDNALLWVGLGIVVVCGPAVVTGPVFAAAQLFDRDQLRSLQQATQWVKIPGTALMAVPFLRGGTSWPR